MHDGQVVGGDESQPIPVPDREPNSDHEPDSGHEAAEPTCSSVDSKPRKLAHPSVNSTIDLKNDVQYFLMGQGQLVKLHEYM